MTIELGRVEVIVEVAPIPEVMVQPVTGPPGGQGPLGPPGPPGPVGDLDEDLPDLTLIFENGLI